MNPNDCEHLQIETLYQYDNQKNKTVLWACPKCRMLFQPKGLANAELASEIEVLQRLLYESHEQGGIESTWYKVDHKTQKLWPISDDEMHKEHLDD